MVGTCLIRHLGSKRSDRYASASRHRPSADGSLARMPAAYVLVGAYSTDWETPCGADFVVATQGLPPPEGGGSPYVSVRLSCGRSGSGRH